MRSYVYNICRVSFVLNDVENLTLVSVFEPIFLKIVSNLEKPRTIFGACQILSLKLNLILRKNISVNTWWKNFLCLEGAFNMLQRNFFTLTKFTAVSHLLRITFDKRMKMKMFFTKRFLFLLFKPPFILKKLLNVDFMIKFYDITRTVVLAYLANFYIFLKKYLLLISHLKSNHSHKGNCCLIVRVYLLSFQKFSLKLLDFSDWNH